MSTRQKKDNAALKKLTLLLDYFIPRRLPFLFIEDLDGYDVALHGPIHIFAANQQYWFVEGCHRYIPLEIRIGYGRDSGRANVRYLEIIELISIEVSLMQLPQFDPSKQR